MKIKLKKLHSSPEVFGDIIFHDGINLIMGEKVEGENIKKGKKTNGVGKSMSIEFINFCLLKSTKFSRVSKIPTSKLDENVKIMLDLEINGELLTIVRTTGNPERPTIIKGENEIEFLSLDDATKYLAKKLFEDLWEKIDISFREFLGPFLRDEGSEFKDILICYEWKNVPLAIKPNAFMFWLDTSIINRIQNKFKEIEKKRTYKSELKKSLTENGEKKIDDVKSTLNALNSDLQKIDETLEEFKTNEAYESQERDLAQLQVDIDGLRWRQAALQYELKWIESFPSWEAIKEKDMKIIYNQFRVGLGDIVARSLEEVLEFKSKIDDFQKKLLSEKINEIQEELDVTSEKINELEDNKLRKIRIIDQKGILKDLKTWYAIYNQKRDFFSNIQNKYSNYSHTESELKDLKLDKDILFKELDKLILEAKTRIDSFNSTILSIHEYIMDSSEASFDIKTINTEKNKQILAFPLRIDDDGSRSINRTKVFIYDLALLFDPYTQERHPHFLIHDNIFDIDQDSLIKSLNYLAKKESTGFQYILTLNRDKIEHEEEDNTVKLNIQEHKVADFTKTARFLKWEKYTEIW